MCDRKTGDMMIPGFVKVWENAVRFLLARAEIDLYSPESGKGGKGMERTKAATKVINYKKRKT